MDDIDRSVMLAEEAARDAFNAVAPTDPRRRKLLEAYHALHAVAVHGETPIPPLTHEEAADRLFKEIGARFNALDVLANLLPPSTMGPIFRRLRDHLSVIEEHGNEPHAMWSSCEVCGGASTTSWCPRCDVWGRTGEWPVAL